MNSREAAERIRDHIDVHGTETGQHIEMVEALNRAVALLDADADGRFVTLPSLKVGDTIYEADPHFAACAIRGIRYSMGMFGTWCFVVSAEVVEGYGIGNHYEYYEEELGRIWFLDRDEAVTAATNKDAPPSYECTLTSTQIDVKELAATMLAINRCIEDANVQSDAIRAVFAQMVSEIDVAPAADLPQKVHGRWLKGRWRPICSVCGAGGFISPCDWPNTQTGDYPYCPWCGATMDSKEPQEADRAAKCCS